jgi:hypothetical protein
MRGMPFVVFKSAFLISHWCKIIVGATAFGFFFGLISENINPAPCPYF